MQVIEVSKVWRWAIFFTPLFAHPALADSSWFPTGPGISMTGYTGNGWSVGGDALVPIFGLSNHFTYINPQFISPLNTHDYTGNFGLGQRWMTPGNIWGAYVFGDYNHTQDHNFWFVSPGLERLGPVFDLSANVYIPVSHSRIYTGTQFADQTGDYSQVTFAGHNQYDKLVSTFATAGWGADTQIAAHLPWRHIKLSIGSYFFAPEKDRALIGGAFRAEAPLNKFLSLSLSESYDSAAHNTLKAGLTLSLGARQNPTIFMNDLSQRLQEPVQRQLIATSGSAHTGEPITQTVEDTGQVALETSNIAFFIPGNAGDTYADGSYENPYQSFGQSNIDQANHQNFHNFYVSSGAYTAEYADGSSTILLNNDSIFGRQDHFKQPASDENRPQLSFTQSGLSVNSDDSADSINNVSLTGAGTGDGINVTHSPESSGALTVNLTDVAIKQFNNGILISNNSNAGVIFSINNAEISDNLGNGITAQNSGSDGLTLSVDGSNIHNNALTGLYLVDYQAGDLTVNFNHSSISANNENGIYALNVFNPDTLSLNIDHSFITANNYNGIQLYNGTGTYNTNIGDLVAHISHSTISNNLLNGIIASNTSLGSLTLDINHSEISNNYWNGVEVININDNGLVNFSIDRSKINNNGLNGIETFNENNSGLMKVSIDHSNVSNNQGYGIFLNNSDSAGDFTAEISSSIVNQNGLDGIYALNDISTGNMFLAINRSEVGGNGRNGILIDDHAKTGSVEADISNTTIKDNRLSGINVVNDSSQSDLNLTIEHSRIVNNQRNGISLTETTGPHMLTAQITDSTIAGNQANAIFAANAVAVTLDHSAIMGTNGISAWQGASITVNNPVYFDADIINHGATINVNGIITPNGSTHVSCMLGVCTFK